MKYFVTGGGGFIGQELVKQLSGAGHECIVLIRNPDRLAGSPFMSLPGVQLVKGDITDKESMRKGMEGCDGIFHLAAWFKLGVPSETAMAEKSNVEGSRNVFELMKELGIKKGVYTSTLAVNSDTKGVLADEGYEFKGQHLTVYDRTKWQAHHEVAAPMVAQGLPLVTVMPGAVYGPGDSGLFHDMFVGYLTRRMPAIPQGTALCWAHVADVAKGHILAMERAKPGETYIIAGPQASVIEVFDLAEKITGIKGPSLHPSGAVLRTAAAILRPFSMLLPLPMEYQPEYLLSSAGTTYIGSNEKAKRELGYNPRPLEEGLREMLLYEMKELGLELPKDAETSKEQIGTA